MGKQTAIRLRDFLLGLTAEPPTVVTSPPTTFSQLIKLGAKPQRDIVENMRLMCHTVSRQLTRGSLTTQPPLANLGTDVEAESAELTKLFFSGHC